MNIPYVFKKCTKCGEWLVVNSVNFNKSKSCKYGLNSQCRKCRAKYQKQYQSKYYEENKSKVLKRNKNHYEINKNEILKQQEQYRKENKEKISEWHKLYYIENKEKILKREKKYRENNKGKILERSKKYQKNNKEKILKYAKEYRKENKEKISEWHKQYRKNNKEKISEQKKQYHASPQGQTVLFNNRCKRRIKEINQGSGISKDQWLEMMNYFNWECAYSGVTLTKENRSIDHINPLNQGGEHEIWNCVPMYKNYNTSKLDKKMEDWYQKQDFYSKDRLHKIYKWQEYAFNKWGDINVTRTIKENIK